MKKGIIAILAISLIVRLFLLFQNHNIWWDASVYLGMGKALYSNYHIGIWEPLRPILWPLVLGFFWKLGFNVILVGNLLQVILSLGIIYLTYSIAKTALGDKEALTSAAIIAFTPVMINFTFRLYTEIPAVFLSLLSLRLLQKNKYLDSGFIAGLAFLTKFPAGLVLVSSMSKIKKLIFGFVIAIIPYFIYNYVRYNDILLPIKEGKYVIKYAGIWLFQQPWHFYLAEFINQNIFYAFSIIGLFLILKHKSRIIPVTGLLLLTYFSFEPHKEARFMILFLPYFAMMSAYGISKLKIRYSAIIVAIVSLVLIIPAIEIEQKQPAALNEYLNFGNYTKGEVLSSTPRIKLAGETLVTPIYYIIFDTNLSNKWENYIINNHKNISYIFLDTCDGGILCPPWDNNCNEARDQLFNTSKILMPNHKYLNEKNCEYHVFYR